MRDTEQPPELPLPRRKILRSSLLGYCGVEPSALRHQSINLMRTPCFRIVFVNRRVGFQNGIDDSPRFFYIVLAGKECAVAFHRSCEQPFVRFHLTGMWALEASISVDSIANVSAEASVIIPIPIPTSG